MILILDPNRKVGTEEKKDNISSLLLIGDPRRPYPTDLEMRSGLLGQMNNPSTNGVNGHLPGDALAAGRLPGKRSSNVFFHYSYSLCSQSNHKHFSAMGNQD